MESVPTVQRYVDNLGGESDKLQAAVRTLIEDTDVDSLSPIEQAEYYSVVTYALDSVIFAYLKSIGADPKTHPIAAELKRVQATMKQIKTARNQNVEPRQRIDTEAAARFIKHSLGAVPPKPSAEEFLQKMSSSIDKK